MISLSFKWTSWKDFLLKNRLNSLESIERLTCLIHWSSAEELVDITHKELGGDMKL